MLSDSAVLEVMELSRRAEQLARGSAADRAQSAVLLQRVSTIKSTGLSSDEARARYASALNDRLNPNSEAEHRYSQAFKNYLRTGAEREFRDIVAGSQSITYTQGAVGGYFVPIEFDSLVRESMAQVTPLCDSDVCDFSMSPTIPFRPGQLSGYDLSSVVASVVSESGQQTATAFPNAYGSVLKSNILFRCTFVSSIEEEQDADDLVSKIVRAASVAIARAIGKECVSSTNFTGALAQTVPASGLTTATGVISLSNIMSAYFSVNRYYRASEKCAFLAHDTSWQRLRLASDGQNRPLLDVAKDKETLMGKPVLISNDLPSLASTNSLLYFGDWSLFRLRMSRIIVRRATQLGSFGDITRGETTFTALSWADASVIDPSGGSNPPITVSTITK